MGTNVYLSTSQIGKMFQLYFEGGEATAQLCQVSDTPRYALASNDPILSGGANLCQGYRYGWIDDGMEAGKIAFELPRLVKDISFHFPGADKKAFNHTLYFNNREEYRELFRDGRNKLFLACLRQVYKRPELRGTFVSFVPTKESISNKNLLDYCVFLLDAYGCKKSHALKILPEFCICTDTYNLDELCGRCEDGDVGSIRYTKAGAVFKMKVGKFILSIIRNEYPELIEAAGEQLINYLIEAVTAKWKATGSEGERYILQTQKEGLTFRKIYDTDYTDGSLGSCMMDDGQYVFYENAVNAQPVALLDNETDKIVCRAVIFNAVYNRENRQYRYLERQYAKSDMFKALLVDKCVRADLIDIYKHPSAGYSDVTQIYDKQGKQLDNCRLHIECNLEPGDTISFQDTFRRYDIGTNTAKNYGDGYSLDTTDETYTAGNWDEYNEEWTEDDLVTVHVWRRGRYYDEQEVSEYYASEHFYTYDGEYYDQLIYSEVMEEDVPLDKICELEDEYKQEHWNYDEYNEEWTEDDLTTVLICVGGNYIKQDVANYYAESTLIYDEGNDIYFVSEDEREEYNQPAEMCEKTTEAATVTENERPQQMSNNN